MGRVCWVLRNEVLRNEENLWKDRERCFPHREEHIQDKNMIICMLRKGKCLAG